jgi:hypothetical protein
MGQTARGARIGVLDLFVPVGEDSHEPAAVRFPIIPRNTRVRPMSPIAQYDEIDNPYRSTATLEMAGEVTETELRAFVGPKFDYYLRKWGPKLEDPSADCGMNWAAFFLSGFWFPYRKMYAATFILYGVSLALAILQQVVFVAVIGAETVPPGVGLIMNVAVALVCGLYGNAWYLAHTQRKIAEAHAQGYQGDHLMYHLARKGGTSLAASLGLAFLASIIIFVLTLVMLVIAALAQAA